MCEEEGVIGDVFWIELEDQFIDLDCGAIEEFGFDQVGVELEC